MKYDVIIIGAGPAGLTAGIYAGRKGMKTAIIAKEIGGTANKILKIENWPGFKGTGKELMKKFYEQIKDYKINIFPEGVEEIEKKGNEFLVKTKNKKLETKSIILATGIKRRGLKIEGEEKLKGRGVSYCVSCDGFFFKNKTVAIFGKDKEIIEPATVLSRIADKVYLIFKGDEKILKEIKKNKKIKIIIGIPEKINGKEKVEGLTINENGRKRELNVEGIFIELGADPIAELIKNLNLKTDSNGFVIVDEEMRSSVPGIFAAGEITNSKLKQVLVSSAQGAIAANSANYLVEK